MRFITLGKMIIDTHLAVMSLTDFPVSRHDETRLFAKISGATSLNMWFVAR